MDVTHQSIATQYRTGQCQSKPLIIPLPWRGGRLSLTGWCLWSGRRVVLERICCRISSIPYLKVECMSV